VKLEVVRNRYFTDMNRGPLFRRPWGMANISEYTPNGGRPRRFVARMAEHEPLVGRASPRWRCCMGQRARPFWRAKVVKDGRRD